MAIYDLGICNRDWCIKPLYKYLDATHKWINTIHQAIECIDITIVDKFDGHFCSQYNVENKQKIGAKHKTWFIGMGFMC